MDTDKIRYNAASVVFRQGTKIYDKGIHRTLSEEPKGKGWVLSVLPDIEIFCKPEKIKEAIEYFKIAYEIHPNLTYINHIANGYEIIGDKALTKKYYDKIKTQAENENNDAYLNAAIRAIKSCSE